MRGSSAPTRESRRCWIEAWKCWTMGHRREWKGRRDEEGGADKADGTEVPLIAPEAQDATDTDHDGSPGAGGPRQGVGQRQSCQRQLATPRAAFDVDAGQGQQQRRPVNFSRIRRSLDGLVVRPVRRVGKTSGWISVLQKPPGSFETAVDVDGRQETRVAGLDEALGKTCSRKRRTNSRGASETVSRPRVRKTMVSSSRATRRVLLMATRWV